MAGNGGGKVKMPKLKKRPTAEEIRIAKADTKPKPKPKPKKRGKSKGKPA